MHAMPSWVGPWRGVAWRGVAWLGVAWRVLACRAVPRCHGLCVYALARFVSLQEGPPPGFAPTERVIVLIGGASVVGHATAEINECLHGSGPFGGGGGARYAPY